jgi:CDP-diacylglycerol--glycerol-3-phosphate 3-phosphatidyltransferase
MVASSSSHHAARSVRRRQANALRDIYFAWFLLGLVACAAVLYAVRVAVRGVARSERVARIGGTALVGQEVMDWTYWAVEPIVRGLVAVGITANGATWIALVLGLGAGVAAGFSWFGLACLLATWSTLFDILDGQIARLTKSGSNFGELLDAATDRYTEFALIGGLVFAFRDTWWIMAFALGAMLACFMISYASAKAEALHVEVPRGLMRRHERATYIITGCGLTSMLGTYVHDRWENLPPTTFLIAALAIVAAIGNIAAVVRLVRIGRALR